MDSLVDNKYTVGEKIGQGAHCSVYWGHSVDPGVALAIKFEPLSTPHPQLEREASVYDLLAGVPGIPKKHWCGVHDEYRALVIDLLGPSVEDLRRHCNGFSPETVLLLADKMITLIEAVHKKGVVHGDLQPDHFLMGLGQDGNSINLVDFGCARCDRVPVTGAKEDLKVLSEDYCASINSHNGEDLSRKDDLESLVYVLLNLYCGPLPWKGLKKFLVVGMKESAVREIISRDLPKQFAEFLEYAQSLSVDDTPDYSNLREMFKRLYSEQGFSLDPIFDWYKQK